MIRSALLVAAGVGVALGVPTVALAHGGLTDTSPHDHATLTQAPRDVKLRFSESPESEGTTVMVTGPTGKDVAAGPPEVTVTLVSVPLRDLTKSGKYLVSYSVAFDDGDVVTGSYAFTLKLPPPVAATTSPAATDSPAATVTAEPTESVAASPVAATATPADAQPSSSSRWWLLAALSAAGAGLAGALGVRRRRHSAS